MGCLKEWACQLKTWAIQKFAILEAAYQKLYGRTFKYSSSSSAAVIAQY